VNFTHNIAPFYK